jgi:hypothetical protein
MGPGCRPGAVKSAFESKCRDCLENLDITVLIDEE